MTTEPRMAHMAFTSRCWADNCWHVNCRCGWESPRHPTLEAAREAGDAHLALNGEVASHYYSAHDLELAGLNPFLSVNTRVEGATLEVAAQWVEYLDFHQDRRPDLFDAEGWPVFSESDLYKALMQALKGRVRLPYVYVDVASNYGEDDPNITIIWHMDLAANADSAAIAAAIWPVAAELANVTDPGTFGAPYLFDLIPEKESA